MADGPPRARVSAGILLFRQTAGGIEVLLGHPGGPYFEHRETGIWSIPKGEVEDGEDLWSVARREFGEETGHVLGSAARTIELGSVTQRGGKVVHAWAVEGDLDTSRMRSNLVEVKFPFFAKREWPEVDQWRYFGPDEVTRRMKDTQLPLLDRLEQALARSAGRGATGA